MTRVSGYISSWLNRPQQTRGDDLFVGLLVAAILWAVSYLGGWALDAIGLLAFEDAVPLWAVAVAGGAGATVGLWLARRVYARTPQTHELYSEHIRDALSDLRRFTDGELPTASVRDYIETGILQPAHNLLTTRGRKRGGVRFSVLHPDAQGVFRMCDETDLFPALGHSPEARQEFTLEIDGSFSGYAYRSGRVQASNDLENDDRWSPHPRARPGREYASMISVPLVRAGESDGVFNVIATRRNAFDRVDQTYVTLLGSVIDVVRSVARQWV